MAEERTITLEFRWTVSRGRDTYGYNICTLYADGARVARCNGGGYDMEGTVLGNFLAANFRDRLLHISAAPAEPMVPCDRCGGTGKAPARCTACHGHGSTLLHVEGGEADWQFCERCQGSGHDPEELQECTHCDRGQVRNEAGKFYGLTFHDPNYDPGKAIIGQGAVDRTLGAEGAGLTVAEAEERGISIGLERYQAIYAGSSPWPTERHVIPSIDGACGMSSVEKIGRAIGLSFEGVRTRSKNLTVILLHVEDDPKQAAG